MADTTELGAEAWNAGIDSGTIKPHLFELATDRWHSQSSGAGRLILGTQPMSNSEREGLLYKGEELTYPDEISLRLLHEIAHGALFLAHNEPNMKGLLRLATDARRVTNGKLGLSALGSHPHYVKPEDKAVEDTTELLRKRMKNGQHLAEYTNFLSDPYYESVRREHGVATLEDASFLNETVDKAIVEAFAKARR